MKLGLPGDITGGLMLFGIMFTIAVIELYAVKALQAPVLLGDDRTRCLWVGGKWNSDRMCCSISKKWKGQNFPVCS